MGLSLNAKKFNHEAKNLMLFFFQKYKYSPFPTKYVSDDIIQSVKQFRSQMRPHILQDLIQIQTNCKGHQGSPKFAASGQSYYTIPSQCKYTHDPAVPTKQTQLLHLIELITKWFRFVTPLIKTSLSTAILAPLQPNILGQIIKYCLFPLRERP